MADDPKRKPSAESASPESQARKAAPSKPEPEAKGEPKPPESPEAEDAGKALGETQEQPAAELPPAADEPRGEDEPAEAGAPGEAEVPPDEEVDEDELAQAEEELTQIISAETREWEGLEAAEQEGLRDEAEVRSGVAASVGAAGARAKSAITSGFEAVGGERITSGLGAVGRRIRFPLWARFLTAAFVIVASVGTATAASLLLYIGGIADDLKLDPEFRSIEKRLETVDGGEPQTILILGSDKRPEFKNNKFRGLSDTTMLLRVDPDRNAIALFSLPRDLRVEIPGYGTAKLNEAYFAGGPELTLRTIQDLTKVPATDNQGLEVNHIVNVDFEGFARAVNAIDCVYVDVDRRYYHSNAESVEQYEEIDIQPGYQALCGFDALDYARFRHLDNDVVRAARQQDFLREARHKVPPEVVFAQRKKLIDIFTEHTTSDIDSQADMLEVLKLFIEARDAPVREVHFEGELGPSYVYTTPEEINTAVKQFLGIQDTPGARADTAQPEDPNRDVVPEAAPDDTVTPSERKAAERAKRKRQQARRNRDAQLVETSYGKQLAKSIRARKVKLPIYYPTVLESGTDYAQKPRVYKINGTGGGSPPNGQRAAYKWVFSRPTLGEYYGFMATRWRDPPILDAAHDEREIGDRTYKLYYDGDRLRMVAWQDDNGSFWLSNTLIQSLSDREMIDIAKGMTELPKLGKRG